MGTAAQYREVGEAAIGWALAQVTDDDGPAIPFTVPADGRPAEPPFPEERDCLYRGIGGLALALAEVRLSRDLTAQEQELAEAVRRRLVAAGPQQVDPTLYFGLAGDVAALRVLGAEEDTAAPLARLAETVTDQGWLAPLGPGEEPVPLTDVVVGTAGITMTALWSTPGTGGDRAADLVATGAAALVATADETPDGLDWPMQVGSDRPRMPNYSHGTAGVVAALAVAGSQLGRPDVVDAAVRGAEHLVAIADLGDDGFLLPLMVPHTNADLEPVTFTWCHGPTGTSYAFAALAHAGVREVAGHPVDELHRRCLRSVATSGLPERLRPGFWDNDGRCCGTAGVAEAFLDAAQSAHARGDLTSADEHLAFARRLGDALLDRVVRDEDGARWRFVEHRAEQPLLDPGVGWMQGAAGIGALLLRLARVLDDREDGHDGDDGFAAPVVDRPDQWWAVPPELRTYGPRTDGPRIAAVRRGAAPGR